MAATDTGFSGDLLKQRRVELHYSQQKLADLLNDLPSDDPNDEERVIAQTLISDWEHEKRRPNSNSLRKLAKVLGVSVAYFFVEPTGDIDALIAQIPRNILYDVLQDTVRRLNKDKSSEPGTVGPE